MATSNLSRAESVKSGVHSTRRLRLPTCTAGYLTTLVFFAALFSPACTRRPAVPAATTRAQPPSGDALVQRKDFIKTLRIHGTVEAVRSWTATAPRLAGSAAAPLVVTKLVPAATQVKKGDLLVEFDRQGQLKTAQDRRSDYLDFVAQIRKKQAEQDVARAKDETELQQAGRDVERARLEILKNEMLSRIAAEKNDQALEEAQATLKQLRETFELKRQSAKADLRILEIQRDRALAAAHHAETNATKMAVTAPLDGLAVLKTTWKSSSIGEVQEGEEVRPGVPIVEVVSRAGMQVRAKINQADRDLVRPGLPVTVRLDAYPGISLPGRLESLTPVAGVSDLSTRVRYFVALFSLASDEPRVMPDLSAAVDVELTRLAGALVVPRGALRRDEERWFLFAPGGDRLPVVVAAMNDLEAAIGSGVTEGSRIVGAPAAPASAPRRSAVARTGGGS